MQQGYSPDVGESEERLRAAFQAGADAASAGQQVVVFLDEADALCPVRNASQPHEARIVAQLLTIMDGLAPNAGMELQYAICSC